MQVQGRQFHFDKLFKDNTEGTAVNFSGITLYQLGDLSCLSGYQVPLHKQWCHEISYVISGEGLFTTNNETELLMEGYVHFSPAGSMHAIQTTGSDLRYGYIGFDFDSTTHDADIVALKRFYESTKVFSAGNCRELLAPLTKNLDEIYNRGEFYNSMVAAYIKQMLITVYRAFTQTKTATYFDVINPDSSSRAFSTAANYIAEHIYEKIKIGQMCEKLGYTPSYISNTFKKATGLTVQKYINNLKMQKAIEMMQYGKISETKAALKLGYSDLQTFNKAFRRTMGCSPVTFINEQAQEPQSDGK